MSKKTLWRWESLKIKHVRLGKIAQKLDKWRIFAIYRQNLNLKNDYVLSAFLLIASANDNPAVPSPKAPPTARPPMPPLAAVRPITFASICIYCTSF